MMLGMTVGRSTTLVETLITEQLLDGLTCADIHGPQQMNFNDFATMRLTNVILGGMSQKKTLVCHEI